MLLGGATITAALARGGDTREASTSPYGSDLPHRAYVAGLASDQPQPTPTPTPTPTPIPGGSPTPEQVLEIYVELSITAREINLDGDGMVDIPIFAAATAHFPMPNDQPVTVQGAVTIAPHPVDAAGCEWARTYVSADFTMTVSPPIAGSNGVSLQFEAPEWHYTVTCPTDPPFIIRVPAFGAQPMLAFLGFAFPEYYGPFAGGAPLDVPPVSVAPACIVRETVLQRTSLLADATLRAFIYEPPCPLP